jgi:cell division septum initiation protein DivIVA
MKQQPIHEQAKKELSGLLDELFVQKLRSDIAAWYENNQKTVEILRNKLDAHQMGIAELMRRIKVLEEESLPTQLEPLKVLPDISKTINQLGQAMVGNIRSLDDSIKQQLNDLQGSTGELLDSGNRKLVMEILEQHQASLQQASAAVNLSFTEMAAAIQSTAEQANHSQTALQEQLASLRTELRDDLDNLSGGIMGHVKNEQNEMFQFIEAKEKGIRKAGVAFLVLFVLQAAVLGYLVITGH